MDQEATAGSFVAALYRLGPELSRAEQSMFRVHYRSSGYAISAEQMAKAVGNRSSGAANLRYGKLADKIGSAVGMADEGPLKMSAIATFVEPGSHGNQHWLWVMRPALAKALEDSGWVRGTDASNVFRLTTWNCCRGSVDRKLPPLLELEPDVAVVQECGQLAQQAPSAVWTGDNPRQGLLILSGRDYQVVPVERLHTAESASKLYLAARVEGRISFNVLAAWVKPCDGHPAYVSSIHRGLDAHASFLRAGPTVFIGDLNSHPKFRHGHERVVERLESEFGLVSAYHAFTGEQAGDELTPTFYLHRNHARPFHIDYCFVPKAWRDRIVRVKVEHHRQWSSLSNHCPMGVDLQI